MTAGQKIKEARVYGPRPMSQERLAEGARTSKSHISNIENDKQVPGLKIFMRIAKALEVDPAKLLPDD